MKVVKRTQRHAIVKVEKGEGFEDRYKYMVILDYDASKEYCGLDGDIYKETYKEAVAAAYSLEH